MLATKKGGESPGVPDAGSATLLLQERQHGAPRSGGQQPQAVGTQVCRHRAAPPPYLWRKSQR